MPEEINWVLTDSISDLLFTTEPAANKNLAREGIPGDDGLPRPSPVRTGPKRR